MNNNPPARKTIPLVWRHYLPGEEEGIVSFLNLSYGEEGWGNLERWRWYFADNPGFDPQNVLLVESDGRIVGHRGVILKNLSLPGGEIPLAQFGATAVHTNLRGGGLYTQLHDHSIDLSREWGASLMLSTGSTAGITHQHNLKTGFMQTRRLRYFYLLNPEKVFKKELSAFIATSPRLRKLLLDFQDSLYLGTGKALFSAAEILGAGVPPLSHERVEIKFVSLPWLFRWRKGSTMKRVFYLPFFLFNFRLRSTSLRLLFRFLWRAVKTFV